MRIAVKLAKTLGKGIAGAATGGVDSVMDMEVSSMLDGILTNFDENETPKLVAELLSKTSRNGVFLTTDVIDKVYAQNFGEMISALSFSLEVNFGGFIEALSQAANTGNALQQGEETSQ